MIKKRIWYYGIIILLMTWCLNINAQSIADFKKGDHVKIVLVEGTSIVGTVISKSSDTLIILSKSLGEVQIIESDIAMISITSEAVITETSFYEDNIFDNPLPNKNFLTETAFTIEEGEKVYQNIMLGAQYLTIGLSDKFNLIVGTELFNLFEGSGPSFQISTKYSIGDPDESVNFAAGANLLFLQEGFRYGFGGSLYGVVTFGNRNHNLTTGLGIAFYDGESSRYPVLQLGGMTRLSKRVMLVADNILLSERFDTFVLGTATIRFIWDRLSLDIGVGTDYNYGAIPVIGGSYKL